MVAWAAVSCSSPDVRRADHGESYFPLQKGFYQRYDVNQVKYVLGVPETLNYELKVQVADSFATQNGDYTYVLYRSKRSSNETSWTYIDTWSATRSDRQVVMQEENVPYVKLTFPVAEGITWNGNLFNTTAEETYSLQEFNRPQTIGGTVYDDCVTVMQSDNNDFIVFLDQRKEVYARNAGLVFKQTTQLHYCTDTNAGCLGQQIVDEGIIYTQTLKEYGVE